MNDMNRTGLAEIFISYAWEPESEDVVARFESECLQRDISLKRDRNNIGFKG